MSDLIKRIDKELEIFPLTSHFGKLINDCKAEIQRLSAVGETVACIECNGSGVDPVPRPVCCGNPENGECCGVPEPDWSRCERCEGNGFTDTPPVARLISEIDNLEVQIFEISRPPWTEEAYHKDDIKPILDKYRSKS